MHVYLYELLVGQVPPEMELDHLCKNRGCVNPDHLEPVTHTENMRRLSEARLCKVGHPLGNGNRKVSKNRSECLTCYNAKRATKKSRRSF